MKRYYIIAIATLVALLIFMQCTTRNTKEETSDEISTADLNTKENYMPFPEGYGFPESRDTLNRWVASQNVPAMRDHAWKLWAGLNQTNESGLKVWQSWYNLNQMFKGLSGSGPPSPDPGLKGDKKYYGLAPDYPLKGEENCGGNFEGRFINTVDALLLFSVYYNEAAHDWIMNKDLNLEATLKTMNKDGEKDIPDAPEEAFIIKQIYYPVKAGDDRYTALPVWDGPGNRDPLVYNGFETWERAVAITTNPNPPETVPVEYLYGLTNRDSFHYEFLDATPVSVDQFYYLKLDKETLANFTKADSCIVNSTFNYVHNEDFQEGDYLVSIAMHYLTKELKDWTMQTVWWHDKPMEGPFAANRPTDIPSGKWENYLLSQAYYMAVPNKVGGKPHIAYNPYIELMVPEENRMQSNCQNCHRRAGYPIFPPVSLHPIGYAPPKWGPGANYDPLVEGFISNSDTIFNGVLRTDFNWAIPMNAK